MEKQKQKLIIDVDRALAVHNEQNPDAKMSRTDLAEKLGLTYQSLTNYQGGRIPEIIGTVNEIITITGVEYSDLVKIKK